MDSVTAFTPTIDVHVPVKNIVDDLTKVRGSHSFQFGVNYRQVDNLRESNEQNFFGQIPMSSGPTIPALQTRAAAWTRQPSVTQRSTLVSPRAMTSPSFPGRVDSPSHSQLRGEQEPEPDPARRTGSAHFRDHEYEVYAQDQWRMASNFTFTYGLRYSILQPPFETTGTQVAPTISLNNWFNQRSIAAYQGQVYNPTIGFALDGQANGKQPYWGYDYKTLPHALPLPIPPRARAAWPGSSGADRAKPQFAPATASISITSGKALLTPSIATARSA